MFCLRLDDQNKMCETDSNFYYHLASKLNIHSGAFTSLELFKLGK